MDQDFIQKIFTKHKECPDCAAPQEVIAFFEEVLKVLFPDFATKHFSSHQELESHISTLRHQLTHLLNDHTKTGLFFGGLENIHSLLVMDVEAMYQGDPAAKSEAEVIKTYPGFFAIAAYRMAHELHRLKIGMIPRIITEYAHGKTGIDIHPAAKIGKRFCIDHGTGVVIGETAEIGDNVKVYQGVTLGALSVEKADAEKKRHPTIEDNVIIYSGATILGGNTTIGHDSVIGGNVWLTRSVPTFSKIYYKAQTEMRVS